jgi:hypothetical protein
MPGIPKAKNYTGKPEIRPEGDHGKGALRKSMDRQAGARSLGMDGDRHVAQKVICGLLG